MFKVFKYLKPVDWLLVTCCAGFVVLQVFAELKMPEYVSAITLCMKTGAPTSEVWINGAFMLLCALGAAGSLLIVGFFAAFVGARIAKRLREELYDKVTDFSLADVNRFSVATLITRSTNDVTQVQMLFAMGQCDIVKISDDEVLFLSGCETVEEGAMRLRERYGNIRLMLTTLGKEGSVAYYGDLKVQAEPFLNPDTIETTGAGDTFCACVLSYVLEHGLDGLTEENLKEMLIFANGASSLITTKRGALKVMPEKQEVEAYISGR